MVISGQLSHELEVNVPASQVWELYGTLRLSKLIEERFLGTLVKKIDVTEGNGGVGTIVHLNLSLV